MIIALLFAFFVSAGELTFVDGDTVDRGAVRYRIHRLDAPEIRGAGCAAERERAEASRAMAERIIAEAVRIEIRETGRVQPATERYRERREAEIFVDGVSFNDRMIAAGAARIDARGDPAWCDVPG